MFLCRTQAAEAIAFLLGLTAVALDGVFQRQRFEVVHMPRMHAQSPEGHRPQFIGGICGRVLDDAIAGSDVMEQKIAIRVNDLVAEGLRYCERSAIDGSSRRSRDDGADAVVALPGAVRMTCAVGVSRGGRVPGGGGGGCWIC